MTKYHDWHYMQFGPVPEGWLQTHGAPGAYLMRDIEAYWRRRGMTVEQGRQLQRERLARHLGVTVAELLGRP